MKIFLFLNQNQNEFKKKYFYLFLKAIMTFYLDSLSHLNAYGELRTYVFHQFTQIGNAIAFSLLLEQALVSEYVFIYLLLFIYLFITKRINEWINNGIATCHKHEHMYDQVVVGLRSEC